MHRLMEGAQRLVDELYEQEGMAVLSRLAHAVSEIGQLEALDARLRGAAVLLREATIPIEEASAELRHYLSQLDADPARLAWVEQRLAQIQGLARKHRLAPEQLLALQEQLRGQLDAWQQDATQLTELRARLAQHEQRYRLLAGQLRELRRQGARQLEEWVSTDIQHLGLSGGRFVVSFQLLERFSPSGLDRIEFSAVTNPGQPLLPLAKVASGGELSRISLALQVASAQTARIPTLMFDEVDVGIGGRVAEIVGQKLLTLALNRQVLCITHLPQVAALGQQHLQVSKRVTGDSTRADIHYLAAEARVAELARMSGGVEITHQTLAHARDLLARGQRQVHS
jgi:DNA repair protein RecN (Recombination protein N)